MPDDLILTFDLGTTRLKVALFDLAGNLIGQKTRRHVEHQDGVRVWQDADQWWQDCTAATRELLNQTNVAAEEIIGCSLSGRAGAAVFVDASGGVIRNPWSDARHDDELRELLDGHGPGRMATYGATLLGKFAWLRRHEPEAAERVRHVLYAKDFLLFRLTGQAVTDPSSGPDGPWDTDILDALRIDPSILPEPALPWTLGGTVTAEAAGALGLTEGTPVAVGAHDGICANTGAGSIGPGEFAITLGTHAVVRAVTGTRIDGAFRFYGFPPDKHIIGGNALMAGRALDWFVDNWFDAPEHERQSLFADLDRQALHAPPGAHGVFFLPFLRGRIAPERRPRARAAFFGLSIRTTRSDMFRAVIEGATFALADVFDQVVGWAGEPRYIGVTGGGANSRTWLQCLADVIGRPLTVTDAAAEGRGAAIFCATALGRYADLESATRSMVRVTRTIAPGETNHLQQIRADWQSLVTLTRPLDAS